MPIGVRVLDHAGDTIPGAPVQVVSFAPDTLKVDTQPLGLIGVQARPCAPGRDLGQPALGSARGDGRAGARFAGAVDSLTPDTVATADSASAPLVVHLLDLRTDTTQAIGLSGYPVVFAIVYPPFASPAAATVGFGNDTLATLADTVTTSGGAASVMHQAARPAAAARFGRGAGEREPRQRHGGARVADPVRRPVPVDRGRGGARGRPIPEGHAHAAVLRRRGAARPQAAGGVLQARRRPVALADPRGAGRARDARGPRAEAARHPARRPRGDPLGEPARLAGGRLRLPRDRRDRRPHLPDAPGQAARVHPERLRRHGDLRLDRAAAREDPRDPRAAARAQARDRDGRGRDGPGRARARRSCTGWAPRRSAPARAARSRTRR